MAGHDNHGNTPAAWTGVTIALIGFTIGCVFTLMARPLGVAAGAGVVALGGLVGLIMRSMGLGQQPATAPRPAPARAAEAGMREAAAKAEEAVAAVVTSQPATTQPEPQQAVAGS